MGTAQTVESIIFDATAPAYTLRLATTAGGGTAANLTFGGTAVISLASGSAAQQIGVGDGSLVLNSALAINNNSSQTLTLGRPMTGGGNVTLSNAGTGSGEVDISGIISNGTGFTTALTQNSATSLLKLTGANTYTGQTKVSKGGLTISSGGVINNPSTALVVSDTASTSATLNLSGGTVTLASTAVNPSISLGAQNGANGVIQVGAGGTLTMGRQTWMGNGGASQSGFGALIVNGGSVTTGAGGNAGLSLGRGSAAGGANRGEVIVTGGSLSVYNGGGNTQIGSDNTTASSTSVMTLSGGTTTFTGTGKLIVGRIANGILNISGTAAVTVISTATAVNFGEAAGVTGILNLNGGTLTTPAVTIGSGSGYCNFNGGTLKANKANAAFMSTLTAAYVYGGGAVMDDGGYAITVGQPLLTPTTGNGVSLAGMSFSGAGFGAPPIVEITGTGIGASAIATIDGSGNLSGVTLTCPGVGYTGTPTLAFTGGGATVTQTGSASTAANTSGGLTKLGAGTLTLAGANTYTGNTTVNGGKLVLQQPTLNVNSTVTVTNGGVLQLDFAGGTTVPVAALVLDGVSQPAGIYNSSTTPAYLAGAGGLQVGTLPTSPTTTTVTTSGSPAVYGHGTFTATISPTSGAFIPTGTVQFQTNGVNFGAPVAVIPGVSPNGVAVLSSTLLPVLGSPYAVAAVYTPQDSSFTGSTGTLSGEQAVSPAPLLITANDAIKFYDGTSFSGGNGVNYAGLANGETAAALSGALSYGGTSQGAVSLGTYTIIPSGLSSPNYSISYASGALVIRLTPAPNAQKPNIIFIFCDDFGYNDLGCNTYPSRTNPGPPPAPAPTPYSYVPAPNTAKTLTPNIDSLADSGLRLTSFYAAPVCSASRSQLMTGCYSYRLGIYGALAPTATIGLNTTEVTLAALLKLQGYATAAIGKWHLGYQPQFLPTRRGFDQYFGVPYSQDMSPLNLIQDETAVDFIGTDSNKLSLLTQRYTTNALEFIERNQHRPFFIYMPQSMPHVPVYASTNFKGASGKSYYYDVIMELDWSVGQIMTKLRALGLETNTLVIFSSDNGPWQSLFLPGNTDRSFGSAYPLRDSKHTTWDGGTRVPFVAHWPGHIPAGLVSDTVGSTIDMLPTLVKLAGGSLPTDRIIDGADLWPVMSGQPGAVSPNTNLFFFKEGFGLEAVRSGSLKLRENGTNINLSNLAVDIQEATNLVLTAPALYNQTHQLMSDFNTALNATLRTSGTYSPQEIVLSTNQFTIAEGGSGTFQIRLATNTTTTVTVNIVNFMGDPSVQIGGPQTFTFTPSNWNVYQTVTVKAAADANAFDGVALLRCSSIAFQPVRDVFVTALDTNTTPGLEVTLLSPTSSQVQMTNVTSLLLAQGVAATNNVPIPSGVTYNWSCLPSEGVTLTTPNASLTGVRFPTNGNYTVQLSATLGALSASNSFQVVVGWAGLTNMLPAGDLVAWLAFDESNGVATADSSGNNNPGLLSGSPVWHPGGGRINGAIEFNSADDLATIAGSSQINLLNLNKRTISLWFNAAGTGGPAGTQVIYEEGGLGIGLNVYLRSGVLYLGGYNGSGTVWSTFLVGTNTIIGGQWHHVALVLDATNALTANAIRGYLDGTLFGAGSAATMASHNDGTGIGGINQYTHLDDGSGPATGTDPFAGMVDELMIYNRALSATEIAALATGASVPAGLWPAAPVMPQISLVQSAPSSIQLIWQDGQLQTSTNLVDWTDVPSVSSPYSPNLNNSPSFWRVRQPDVVASKVLPSLNQPIINTANFTNSLNESTGD